MRKLILMLLAICAVSLTTSGVASADLVTINTPGTYVYTVPAGTTSLKFAAWGAGGSAGGAQFFSVGSGGGGGGAYASSTISVTPGQTFTVTVEAGGVGQNHNNPGQAGGDTKVTTSSGAVVVLAKGGGGGQPPQNCCYSGGGIGGQASASTGTVTFNGGNGGFVGGGQSGGGGGGGSGGSTSAGGTGGQPVNCCSAGVAGIGGAPDGGNGGVGNGSSGNWPGGGGGGSFSEGDGALVGGSGGPGGVVIGTSAPPPPPPCTNCPPYVEYTGSTGGGADAALAPAGAAAGAAVGTAATSTVFLDPGDVFKLNAAKTGYDYVDGFTLLNSPGWCNSTPNTPDSGYWCGVTPLPIIPAPINSFKQAEADPPSCTLSNADVLPISSRNGGAISAIIQMTCNEKLPAIFTWTQLVKLKALGQFPGTTKASNAQSWVNTSNPQPPPGVVYSCDAASWITKGFVIYKIYIDYVLVGTDGHVYQSPQWSSGNFTLLASKRSPVCA